MQTLDERFDGEGGEIRWTSTVDGPPIVLVHGTPYSSLIWRAIMPAISAHRRVFLLDLLGYGQSEQREGQDLGIAAQSRRFARLLEHWRLDAPSVVATDIGGAIALRALLLEGACCGDLLLVGAVTGGEWERGLFALMLEHADVFAALPGYAHRALVASHMQNATHLGFRPGVLDDLLAPWIGAEGQAAYYRTAEARAKDQDMSLHRAILPGALKSARSQRRDKTSDQRFPSRTNTRHAIPHRTSFGCLDRRRAGPRFLALRRGPAKEQPVPTVVRCRKRQQDVAPRLEGLVYEDPQRYLLVGAL